VPLAALVGGRAGWLYQVPQPDAVSCTGMPHGERCAAAKWNIKWLPCPTYLFGGPSAAAHSFLQTPGKTEHRCQGRAKVHKAVQLHVHVLT
jgi:hypothetical protein